MLDSGGEIKFTVASHYVPPGGKWNKSESNSLSEQRVKQTWKFGFIANVTTHSL